MKLTVIIAAIVALFPLKAIANPCVVCTAAIAGSLTLAKKLGVDECVIGVWSGAMLAMVGYWMIRFFEKRRWTFPFYRPILMASSLAMVGLLYIRDLTYSPSVIFIFYLDSFLFATLFGAVVLMFGLHFYAYLKRHNGGHAHFPFEKVILPVLLVFLASMLVYYNPNNYLCNCDRKAVISSFAPLGFDD